MGDGVGRAANGARINFFGANGFHGNSLETKMRFKIAEQEGTERNTWKRKVLDFDVKTRG